MKFITSLFFLIIIISCNQENLSERTSDDFKTSEVEVKQMSNDFWIKRVEESKVYFNDKILINHLNDLKAELSKHNEVLVLNKEILDLAIKITPLVSEDMFLKIFCSIDELPKEYINGSYCSYCLEDIIKEGTSANVTLKSGPDGDDLPRCNCKWFCGGIEVACTHDQCASTGLGCGFLWMQSCNQRDEIFASNCPD